MPQFTPWNVPSPFPNVLYNPAAVDQAIAASQSQLGELDVARQRLGLEQRKLDLTQAGNAALLGDGSATAPPADTTPFEQQMGSAEGGNSADKVNQLGYAGQFQFGARRLADLGLYTAAPGEDLKANQWKGMFHIAPYNVASLDDFLKSPAAQHAAFVQHVADIDKTIDATPGADKFDRNGLRAVAHLGGTSALKSFIAAGGNLDRADDNGTSLKQYYAKFAQGGPAALQQSFGSVHGPGGPPSALPAVQPGGRVGAAWVDPNAPLPVPPIPPAGGAPFNPNAGPRVAGAPAAGEPGGVVPPVTGGDPNAPVQIPPPTVPGSADASPLVAPSPIALRTGGTDVAGPGAGQTALPSVEQPNRLYQTGLPGITISGPGNPLAPPGTAPGAAVAPPPAAQAAPVPPPVVQRPPVLQPPPAPSRAIQLEPVIQDGPLAGLTASQARLARSAALSGAPTAELAARMEAWRQQNITNRQTAATAAAQQQQADFARQQWLYEQQVKAASTWEDIGNGMTRNRVTGETKYAGPPTPRMIITPAGDVLEALPGGGVRKVDPADPAAIAARKAAEAQGTGVGQDVAKQLPALAAQGRNAATAIGNIDYGMNQVREATKAGIPTGYFSQGLATAAAAAKSLGIDTSALGVNPEAVGNIQSAQKTLGVVAGAILQQAIGKGGQITDAKIEHFIHTQPGIETDPHAIERVLNWARSQFVYENEMSTAAMKEAADSPTGTLPLNWQARYYRDKGFAPIYDPGSGEMKQPEGQAPSREPPPGPPATAPVNPSARKAGATYQTPKGPLQWTGTGWVAP